MEQVVASNSYLPKSLSYFVKELYSKRQQVRFSPNTSGDAKAGDIIRVRFPTGVLDLSTFSMRFEGNIDGQDAANGIVGRCPSAYKFFKSVRFIAGGVQVNAQNQYYSRVKNAIIKSSCSADVFSSHLLQNYQEDKVALAQQSNHTAGATAYLVEDNFLGLPQSQAFYDTSVWGMLECEIQLEDNSIIKENSGMSASDKAQMSYRVSNIQFTCDTITPPSIYAVLLSEKLKSKTPLRMSFANIVSSKQGQTGENRLNLSTKCLDMFMAIPLDNSTASNGYETRHFVYPSGAASLTALKGYTFQLTLGEDTFPKNAREDGVHAYDMAVNAWHHGDINGYNLLGAGAVVGDGTLDAWRAENHILSMDLTLEGMGWAHPQRVLSGIDTRNQALDCIWSSEGYTNNWLLCAMTTAQLVYNPETESVAVEH